MAELQHHGIKGMKWGVRRYQNEDGSLTPAGKKRKYQFDFDKKPEQSYMSRSMRQQVKQGKLKTAMKTQKDKTKKKQLKQSYKQEVQRGKELMDEWLAYEKFMHKKVGNTSKIKVTKNPDGTFSYTNKKGQNFEKWQVDAAWEHEMTVSTRRGAAFFNSIIAAGFGALAYQTLKTLT